MTNLEFDVLDELYFIQDFEHIQKELDLETSLLVDVLEGLYQKGWIKCFKNHSDEALNGQADIKNNYRHYLYLASKKGLLAHNAD